jgi:hypothetical protein
MTLTTDITFDTPHGELQDVRAEFELRHCYDWMPDYDPDAGSATLISVTLGDTKMYRAELALWIGAAMVARLEDEQVDVALGDRRAA